MKHPALEAIFLGAAFLAIAAGCGGLFLFRGAAARLHYVSFTALLAPPLVLAAVLSAEGFSQAGLKAILIVGILVVQSPVAAHVVGRAIYGHDHWPPSGTGGSRP